MRDRDEEFQPNWDSQAHQRLAEGLGKATVRVQETEATLEAKSPLTRRLGYEKHRVEGAHTKLQEATEAYDTQLQEAASRKDLAHEQANRFEKIAEAYRQTAKKLSEEFGIDLPDPTMDHLIEMSGHDSMGQTELYEVESGEKVGQILALRDFFVPVSEVEHSRGWRPDRLPRAGLGVEMEQAAADARSKEESHLLHVTSGEASHDAFYHGHYTERYIPIRDDLSALLETVGARALNTRVDRSFDSNMNRFTGYPDLRSEWNIKTLDEVEKAITYEKLPLSVEIHYTPHSSFGGGRYEDRRISTLRAETPEEVKSQLLERLVKEGVVTGKVTVEGREVQLEQFLRGEEAGPEEEAA